MKFEEYLSESHVSVSHDAYKRSHMKNPSGTGNWMVGVGTHDIDHKNHKEGEHYVSHNGKLSDAVKKAKDAARKHGKSIVHVLP